MSENIELTLPVNSAYISAARLTASSIANRLGFGIEEVEDIKTAVSEACTFIIAKLSGNQYPFKLMFSPMQNYVSISLHVPCKLNLQMMEQETSMLMIRALVDEVNIEEFDNAVVLSFSKKHNTISFD